MKNIHLIPTDKPSKLIKNNLGYGIVSDAWKEFDINLIQAQFQNIYITDNSEIKDCWILNTRTNEVYFLNGFYGIQPESKKIILTTDQDLIQDSIQSISDEFLEWFVKNPSCDFIKIINNETGNYREFDSAPNLLYKIIIPQEEPKQYPIGGYTPGFYSCTCVTCKETFQGHKRAYQCEPCAIKMTQEELKLINNCPKCGLDLVEREGCKPVCTRIDCRGIILSNETLKEWALKEEPKQTDENGKPITYWGGLEEPEQEIVGYRLKPFIDRIMVDGILKNAMPIWNDEDKSVYFIRGHVAGSLVAKMKELQVLDLWFIPIYEDEEIKSDWVKEHHLEYYYKEGIMKEEPKQETIEEASKNYANYNEQINKAVQEAVKFGAKWQAKRMYSEEEVLNLIKKGYYTHYDSLTIDKWFEQFKKKQ